MSSRSHKQSQRRQTRKHRNKNKHKGGKPKLNDAPFKNKRQGRAARPNLRVQPGFLGVRPREGAKYNRMNMSGLTMRGGTIKGVTEISANLQLTNSSQNAAGFVLATIPINPQTLAPGTRLSDIAAMYDQYVFTSIKFELDPSLPYACGGRLLGFVERDATDPVGQPGTIVANVIEWMDHGSARDAPIQGGSGQSKLQFPKQGGYMHSIAKGPVGGYYINKIAINGQLGTDILNCFQGQFVLMLHTAINSEGGSSLNYPVPLGPLRVHWTLKLKEAAERNQDVGAADKHIGGAGSATNPIGWSNTLSKQSSLLAWSNLGIQTRAFTAATIIRGVNFSSGTWFSGVFPVGTYMAVMQSYWSATGASNYVFQASANGAATGYAQTGVTWVEYTQANTALSGANQFQLTWQQFQVTVAGELVFGTYTGSSAGWSPASGFCECWIVALPESATSLLKHKNLTLRGIAFKELVKDAQGQSATLRQLRKELGLPEPEKKDTAIDVAWRNILREEEKAARVDYTRPVDSWDMVDEDAWDEKDYDEKRVTRPGDMRAAFNTARTLVRNWHEPDSPTPSVKSDRGKGAREQKEPPRASSLKS